MKYVWIDEGSNSGPVVGMNRAAQDGELEGNITPQELPYWLDSEKYKVVDGVFTVKSAEEIAELEAAKEKEAALTAAAENLQKEYDAANSKKFVYEKDAEIHYYTADKQAIQGTQNKCLSATDKTQPIDTFPGDVKAGMWLCYDVDDNIAFVPFTMEEFINFADAFYMRNSYNFTVLINHETALATLKADPTKTAQDVIDYDLSVGWV